MTDAIYKLGKLPAKKLLGLPGLSKYTVALPTPPVQANYGGNLKNLGMMLNNDIGDCTCAAVGHAIETWTSFTQDQEVVLPDSVILGLYEKFGYVDGDPDTDNGAAASDVLKYWYNNPVEGHKLAAFASVRPGSHIDIYNAIWLFGVCYIGVQLPLTAQGGVWDIAPGASTLTGNSAAGSWGGHCVPIISYDQEGFTCITWGGLKKMTNAFFDAYCDEAFALLSEDWINASGKSPPGFDFAGLTADMQALRTAA